LAGPNKNFNIIFFNIWYFFICLICLIFLILFIFLFYFILFFTGSQIF